MMGFLLLTVLSVTLSGAPEVAKARTLFEKGRAAFVAGDYASAALRFREGHALTPRPLFLFNEAQSLRRQSEVEGGSLALLREARAVYRRYIDTASLEEEERVDALRHLLEIEAKLDAALKAEAPVVVLAPPLAPAPPPPWWQRPAVWIGAGAGLVVIAGVSIGVAVGTSCQASLGCVDARP